MTTEPYLWITVLVGNGPAGAWLHLSPVAADRLAAVLAEATAPEAVA